MTPNKPMFPHDPDLQEEYERDTTYSAAPALPDVAEGDFEHWWKSHAGPKNELAKLWAESAWSASKAAGAGEQRGEAPDDGTEHEFDDSDGIGECSVRVILPGNGWYRCGKTKEEHRPTGDAADQIVSSLYRRFKDWSKRGFGPDDVTWCEVKADVIALMRAELSRNHPSHAGYKAQEAQPLPAIFPRPTKFKPKEIAELTDVYVASDCDWRFEKLEAELSRLRSKEWVSVDKELPPDGLRVVIDRELPLLEFARYFRGQDFPWKDDFGGGNSHSVKRWFRVPTPPDSTKER